MRASCRLDRASQQLTGKPRLNFGRCLRSKIMPCGSWTKGEKTTVWLAEEASAIAKLTIAVFAHEETHGRQAAIFSRVVLTHSLSRAFYIGIYIDKRSWEF